MIVRIGCINCVGSIKEMMTLLLENNELYDGDRSFLIIEIKKKKIIMKENLK